MARAPSPPQMCIRDRVDIASVAWGYNTVESLLKNEPTYLIYEPEELFEILKNE